MRLEAKSIAVISEMGSGRKPWTMGRGQGTTLGRRMGTGSLGRRDPDLHKRRRE